MLFTPTLLETKMTRTLTLFLVLAFTACAEPASDSQTVEDGSTEAMTDEEAEAEIDALGADLDSLRAEMAAHHPIPDTTEAWRYFPLEIGNVWMYSSSGSLCHEYQVRSVDGDTLIDNTRYFLYKIVRGDLSTVELIEPPETFFLRFDSLTATIQAADGRRYSGITTCPLNAALNDTLLCDGSDSEMMTSGRIQDVVIGRDTLRTTVKTYAGRGGDIWTQYAAGIGIVGVQGPICHFELKYAYVSGVEYGIPPS